MNVVQKFQEARQMAMQTQPMPTDKITNRWFNKAIKALYFASPIGLGLTPTEFQKFTEIGRQDLTLMQFAILSNNLESKSANDLQMDLQEYCKLLKDGEAAVKQWEASMVIVEENIKQRLAQEALAEKAKQQTVGGFTPKPAEA